MGKPDQPRNPDGTWKSRGTVTVAAVFTGGALAVGAVGIGTSGTGAASLDSAASQALKGKSSSKKSAQKGRQAEAWQRLGWRQLKKKAKQELKCGPHSFGEVQRFFLRHPCTDLDRAVIAVDDGAGNTIVVSVAWVKMPKASEATDLKRLVDTDGTGNVTPLGAELLGLRGIRFTGENYDSRQSRKLVVIAEAAPGGGRPSEAAMETAVEVAVEFPAP